VVDGAGGVAHRAGPVVEPTGKDAPEDLVEVVFADQERVVLLRDFAVHLMEIERDAVVHLDDEERLEDGCRGPAKDLCEKGGRPLLVTAPNDRVVQLHCHAGDPRPRVLDHRPRDTGGVTDRNVLGTELEPCGTDR